MKIQAAVFRRPHQPFSIETLELAPPRADEVLVKVAAAGVCHSDWHLMTGASRHPTPVVPGHEGAGVVVRVGEGVRDLQPGDHVALNWSPACGSCFYCDRGRPSLCSTFVDRIWAGVLLDGETRLSRGAETVYHFSSLACFADHTVVPKQSCVKMDRDIPMQVAALIGCAVTTGVGAVLNTARVEAGSSIAVFGAGGVGLSVVLGARLAGAARIIAVDRVPAKLKTARALGATDVVVADANANDRIRAWTEGRGADYVFEAVGIPEVQQQCLDAARPGGMVVLAGLAPMGSQTNLSGALITRQEKTVCGSYYGSADTQRDFPRYAALYKQGKLDLDGLISKTYSLEDINQAYADLIEGRLARGLIVFDGVE